MRPVSGIFLVSLLFFGCIFSHTDSFQCVKDELAPRISKATEPEIHRQRRSKDDENFASSRIYVHPDSSVFNSTDFRYLYQDKASPLWRAVETMSRALLVRPMTSLNATIGLECDVFESGVNKGTCINGTLRQECRGFAIPDNLVGEQYVCDGEYGTCGYEGEEGVGVEADFILIFAVTDDPHCSNQDTLAFGAGCNDEKEYHRVVNGYINICPERLKKRNPVYKLDTFLYDLFLHQLTHVLGFAEEPVQNYWESNDNPIIQVNNIEGFKTPKISQYAREYFNCSNTDYIPLENEETQLTHKLYHWDARVLNHELMTALYDNDYAVISNFTWHFFDDSQWYKVNYTFTNSLQQYNLEWGKGEGCSFVTESCVNENYRYACKETQHCTFDRLAKGNCESEVHFDGCSVVIASDNGACLFDVNYDTESSETLDRAQSYGRLSRCFDVKSMKDSNYYPACFKTKIFLHSASGEYAYQIIGHQNYTDGKTVWCTEGGHVILGTNEVLCPPVQEIMLLYDSDDFHIADDFVPPPLCDNSCLTCAMAHDADQCWTCHNGVEQSKEFPGACAYYEVSSSQLVSSSPSLIPTTISRPPIKDSPEIILTILAGSILVFVLFIALILYFIVLVVLNLKKNKRKRRRHKYRQPEGSLAVSTKEIEYEEFSRDLSSQDDEEDEDSFSLPPDEEIPIGRTFSQDEPGVSTFAAEHESNQSGEDEHVYDMPPNEIVVDVHVRFDEETDGKDAMNVNKFGRQDRENRGIGEDRDKMKIIEAIKGLQDNEHDNRDRNGEEEDGNGNTTGIQEGKREDEDGVTDGIEPNEEDPEAVEADQRQHGESDEMRSEDASEQTDEDNQTDDDSECRNEEEEELDKGSKEDDDTNGDPLKMIDQSLDEIRKSLDDIHVAQDN